VSDGSGYALEITAVVDADRNVAHVNAAVACPLGILRTRLNLTLASDNVFAMPMTVSAPGLPLTITKASVLNDGLVEPALAPCNPEYLVHNGLRTFSIHPATGALTVANGTRRDLCLHLSDARAGTVVTAPCRRPATAWVFRAGAIALRRPAAGRLCLGVRDNGPEIRCPNNSWFTDPSADGACQSTRWVVAAFACAAPPAGVSLRWDYDPATRFLRAAEAGRCLSSAGPLASNDAAVAVVAHGGAEPPAAAGAGAGQGLLDVRCGAVVRLAVGVATERDARRAAGVEGPLALALALAAAPPGGLSAHRAWWRGFYDRSAVDLGGAGGAWGPLEAFYCAMVYLMGCSMRPGRVAPSLWGPFSTTDSPGWSDAMTLDYNLEAAFWGAAGSNRPELVGLYADFLFGSRLLPLAARRAAQRDWSLGGWPDRVGAEVMGMSCGPAAGWDRSGGCPAGLGGFAGLALVSCAGPFWGMECGFDDGTRFAAGLAATPLLQYYDATQDPAFLAGRLLPLLAGVADFYAAFAVWNATSAALDLPWTCAQELCASGLRPPRAERNAHQDLAYARMAAGRLLEFTDPAGPHGAAAAPAARRRWARLLAQLAPFPTTLAPGGSVFAEAVADGGGEQPAAASNSEYPISHLAAMFPAQVVRAGAPLAAVGRRTAELLNAAAGFAPGNGFCLSWPAAAQVATREGARELLAGFRGALARARAPNGWPDLGGGGLEQIGAIEALHLLLLRAGAGGELHIFPAWPPGAGPAAFERLRAPGAFLVSAAHRGGGGGGGGGGEGVAAPVRILSEAGRTVAVRTPFAAAGLCVTAGGRPVPVWRGRRRRVFEWPTAAGTEYELFPCPCPADAASATR
jgi:hypothetical protein